MKLEYAVHIDWLADSDGGGYIATVPDLPGCMSDGKTPEEALKNVQEAIASWIEAARNGKRTFRGPRHHWREPAEGLWRKLTKAAAIAAACASA